MSSAWNEHGDVERVYNIPLGAVRKSFLKYKDAITALIKLTLNGVTYDFQKQSKEGLVVCSYGYSNITFFLPDDKSPMTFDDGNNMTINSYFEMLATTDYAVITAWDYFARYLSQLFQNTEDPNIMLPYTMTSAVDPNIFVSGQSSFGTVTTAKDFFAALYNTMSQSQVSLSSWMLDDGTISFIFSLSLGSESVAFVLNLGRK